ncbi:MAG: PfkB family carbohydrate kinase, partial [Anaerolineae bacterium]|nr:PfkB family carbohydrate kinase [Anaerolineae bacterium]
RSAIGPHGSAELAAFQQDAHDRLILAMDRYGGALLADNEGFRSFPAFKITPVDTTAAGDAFMGGVAVALGEGQSLAEAVHWGTAAGALAATKMGAQPSLPERGDLERILREGTLERPISESGVSQAADPDI